MHSITMSRITGIIFADKVFGDIFISTVTIRPQYMFIFRIYPVNNDFNICLQITSLSDLKHCALPHYELDNQYSVC